MRELDTEENNNISTAKFIGAFMVLSGHMAALINYNESNFSGIFSDLGLKIIFMLGGYLVLSSWYRDPNIINYIIKRLFRILPPLIVFVICAIFIAGPLLTELSMSEYFSSYSTYFYLNNIILRPVFHLPGVFVDNIYSGVINGSLWSMPIEVTMYILVLFIAIFATKNKKVVHSRIVLAFFLVVFIRVVQLVFFPDFYYIINFSNVAKIIELAPYYAVGMLFTIPKIKNKVNIQLSIIFAIVYLPISKNSIFNEIITIFVISYFLFSFVFSETIYITKFLRKYEISYGIYLYGFFVQQFLIHYFMKYNLRLSLFVLLILSLILTVILSLLSYEFIEKPAKKIIKKIIKKNPIVN